MCLNSINDYFNKLHLYRHMTKSKPIVKPIPLLHTTLTIIITLKGILLQGMILWHSFSPTLPPQILRDGSYSQYTVSKCKNIAFASIQSSALMPNQHTIIHWTYCTCYPTYRHVQYRCLGEASKTTALGLALIQVKDGNGLLRKNIIIDALSPCRGQTHTVPTKY